MVAVAGLVADASHALWADRVEVPFVKSEVRVTETAGGRVSLAGRSTRRAAHHRRVVRCWDWNFESLAAKATESVSGLQLPGVVLTLAGGA